MNIKDLLKGVANRMGYDVKKLHGATGLRSMIKESYQLLSNLGFKPNTVIDVGVANGTPELYTTFPESYFLLIEPLKEFEPALKTILKKNNGSYLLAAAGNSISEMTINVHPHHLDGSSLLKETMGSEADGFERTIPVIQIDKVVSEKNLLGPFLIKIDVQGAELTVLDGCQQILSNTEVIVLEVSMFHFMQGAPEFHDVILYMKDRGFVAYDIILGWNRPLDNALGQIDIVFVKEDGQFRKDHSYSTLEQLKNFKS